MRLLLMNTCGAEGVVALAEDWAVVAEAKLPGRGASEFLVPTIRGLMERQAWPIPDLGAIAVVTGPGSFTGVRVGLSAAKGLCEAGSVRLVGMSRLALVADSVVEEENVNTVALLDGGRGEYYCGVYRNGVCQGEELLKLDAVRAAMEHGKPVTCEARVAESLGIALVPEPGPEAMLRMARRRTEVADWSDVASVDANYLRRTDAELLVKAAELLVKGG